MADTPAKRTCESLKNPAPFQWQGQVKWEENHGLRGGRKQSLYDYPRSTVTRIPADGICRAARGR
jgi:hypothetical protein